MIIKLTMSNDEVREYEATHWTSVDGVIVVYTTGGSHLFSEDQVVAVQVVRSMDDHV